MKQLIYRKHYMKLVSTAFKVKVKMKVKSPLSKQFIREINDNLNTL